MKLFFLMIIFHVVLVNGGDTTTQRQKVDSVCYPFTWCMKIKPIMTRIVFVLSKMNHAISTIVRQRMSPIGVRVGTFLNSFVLLRLGYSLYANINVRNDEGQTALHRAAEIQSYVQVKALIASGGDVNVTDNKGCTPLHYATNGCCRDERIVHELLKARANIFVKDKTGKTPIMYSKFYFGNRVITKTLLQESIKYGNSLGQTDLLHLAACSEGDADIIQKLIDQGHDINVVDNMGQTALNLAIQAGNSQVALALIRNNASIDDQNGQLTTFHRAAEAGLSDVVETLMRKGVNIHAINNFGQSALHKAVASGNQNVLMMLINAGVNKSHKDNAGRDALQYAIEYGRPMIIKILSQI